MQCAAAHVHVLLLPGGLEPILGRPVRRRSCLVNSVLCCQCIWVLSGYRSTSRRSIVGIGGCLLGLMGMIGQQWLWLLGDLTLGLAATQTSTAVPQPVMSNQTERPTARTAQCAVQCRAAAASRLQLRIGMHVSQHRSIACTRWVPCMWATWCCSAHCSVRPAVARQVDSHT